MFKQNHRFGIIIGLALVLALALGSFAMAASPLVIRVAQENSKTHPVGKGLEFFAQRVNELTDGKVEVRVYHSAELGSARAVVEAVQLGNLEMATATSGVGANFAPELDLFSLPFLFDGIEHLYKVMDSDIGDTIRQSLDSVGLKLLGFSTGGVRQLYTKRPVTSPADVKGMKIRTMEVPTIVETWKTLGAIPVPISFGEVYTALQTGVVDGAESSFLSWINSHHYEVAPYGIRINYMDTGRIFVINKGFFNKQPKNIQDALQQAMNEALDQVITPYYLEGDANAAQVAKEKGAQVLTPDLAPFRKAMAPVYEKFEPTLGVGVIERIQNMK